MYKVNQMLKVPRPGQIPLQIKEGIKVLLVSDAVNNLTRRVQCKLQQHKAQCDIVEAGSPENIVRQVNNHQPDLIVCPYLKTKVPEQIYSNTERPCLIVHPGIVGDQGASSLDWAILNNEKEWGVTVLQADEQMDAGAVWSSQNFRVPPDAIKSALYNGPVTDIATECVLDAVSRYSQKIPASPLHLCEDVKGELRRNMKHADRKIDWEMSAEEIARRVRMSDTTPGAIATLKLGPVTGQFRLFDAFTENGTSRLLQKLLRSARPGEMVAVRNKSVLIKCGENLDEGIWIGQIKQNKGLACKLPTTDTLPHQMVAKLPSVPLPCAHDEIQVVKQDDVCYVYFDFYNGAMDCSQAAQLKATLAMVDNMPDVKAVALMGGERFFSTGIHLCKIACSDNKQQEAWRNINAINDVIKTMLRMKDKVTVAVLRGNAGAGGAMFAAACDLVLSYEGALLTPSYKSMHLYGSEYWTYFFPRRVGFDNAQLLVTDTSPIRANEAQAIGLVDHVISSDKANIENATRTFLAETIDSGRAEEILKDKVARDSNWYQLIEQHRDYELSQMKQNFRSNDFLQAMHNFVFKINTNEKFENSSKTTKLDVRS